MKRFSFVLLSTVLASSAHAADAALENSTYDWSGVFIGAHAGGAFGDVDAQLTSIDGNYDVDGWLVGGQVGWNWQRDRLVAGVVADASFVQIDGDWTFDDPRKLSSDYDFLATARLRGGFTAGNILIYGTGGLALAGVTSKRSDPAAKSSDTLTGYAVGLGAEFAASESLSIEVEFLHRVFDTQDLENYELDHVINTLTVGVNFQL
ncbi:MAG: outer membrane beta-barrel protein [Proteobacteria bacterium]|nr:outer membrane beta-barrel protein [Pseudomonadota bacterium]